MTNVLLFLAPCFIAGYICGRLDFIAALFGRQGVTTTGQKGFLRSSTAPAAKPNVEIDTRTFVNTIQTNDLVKTSKIDIGKTSVAQDDIQASVSKLAQLKGK